MQFKTLTVFVSDKVKVRDIVFEHQLWTHFKECVVSTYSNAETFSKSITLGWAGTLARAPSFSVSNSSSASMQFTF